MFQNNFIIRYVKVQIHLIREMFHSSKQWKTSPKNNLSISCLVFSVNIKMHIISYEEPIFIHLIFRNI